MDSMNLTGMTFSWLRPFLLSYCRWLLFSAYFFEKNNKLRKKDFMRPTCQNIKQIFLTKQVLGNPFELAHRPVCDGLGYIFVRF